MEDFTPMRRKQKQLNVRLSDAAMDRFAEMMNRMHAALGIDVSQADVVSAGLAELEKRYPPVPEAAEKKTTRKRK